MRREPGFVQDGQGERFARFRATAAGLIFLTPSVSEGTCGYARHASILGGESPLRSRESEPLSEGKGVTARWGPKEAGATATA